MKRWAVAYMDYQNNDVTIEIVAADTWQQALLLHSKISADDYADNIDHSSLENTKQEFFNCDSMCDVVEIT